jgi:hypothetical protein
MKIHTIVMHRGRLNAEISVGSASLQLAAKLEQERLDGELAVRLSRSNNDREVGQVAEGFMESLRATAAAEQQPPQTQAQHNESSAGVHHNSTAGSLEDGPQDLTSAATCIMSQPSEAANPTSDTLLDQFEAGAPLDRSLQALGLSDEACCARGAPNPLPRGQCKDSAAACGALWNVKASNSPNVEAYSTGSAAAAASVRYEDTKPDHQGHGHELHAVGRQILRGHGATYTRGKCYACLERTDVVLMGCAEGHASCRTCLRTLLITALGDRSLLPPKCCDTLLDPAMCAEVLQLHEERLLAERVEQVCECVWCM